MQKNRAGQTIIEFAMVSILFIFMMVVTINAMVAFCTQQYLSYALFMTARAYQAAGENPMDSEIRAVKTFTSYVPGFRFSGGAGNLKFPLSLGANSRPLATITEFRLPSPDATGVDKDFVNTLNFHYGSPGSQATTGINVEFTVPFAEISIGTGSTSIKLEASSFFGREVSQSECMAFFPAFLKNFKVSGGTESGAYLKAVNSFAANMEDNGC